MGMKSYFHVKTFTGTLEDIPGLNKEIDKVFLNAYCDVETDDTYAGFVRVVGQQIQFWQGGAGEDADMCYSEYPFYRTYGEEEQMCQALSRHLKDGQINVYVEHEGNDPSFYVIRPGEVVEKDPFA